MDTTPASPASARRLVTILTLGLCLSACDAERTEVPASAAAAPAAAPEVETRSARPQSVPVGAHAREAAAPLPSVSPDDEEFVGWFVDNGGNSELFACGQSMSLPIANPAFLRELMGKLGRGGTAPIYVRLRVRITTGSRLEVTEVVQFGEDEAPVVDCVLSR